MTGNHESVPKGTIVVEIDQDTNGKNYIAVKSAKTNLNDGKWHHIIVIREGPTLRLYVDSELTAVGEGAGIANVVNGKDFVIGRSYYDFPDIEIKYKDVRIYSGVLADEELAGLSHNKED